MVKAPTERRFEANIRKAVQGIIDEGSFLPSRTWLLPEEVALDDPDAVTIYFPTARGVIEVGLIAKRAGRLYRQQLELITAVENAAAGKSAMEAGPFRRVVASMTGRPNAATSEARVTPRESQVLSHVAFGLSNEEIARSLEISVETVKEHVQNLLRKLAVNDRTQAAVWAVRSGVL
jgi:DNA-binding CsgD family transcriptional regulator